jgi:hypothetical protein
MLATCKEHHINHIRFIELQTIRCVNIIIIIIIKIIIIIITMTTINRFSPDFEVPFALTLALPHERNGLPIRAIQRP